jgi:hypothetical protein
VDGVTTKKRGPKPITIVCWLYPGARNYRPKYVNVLFRQVQKHLSRSHRFVCVYDHRTYAESEFDDGIELMPIPEAARRVMSLRNLSGTDHPTCFARLWHFSAEAAEVFPGRVFMFDVDSIPIGDLAPLIDHRKDADYVSLYRTEQCPRPYVAGGSWILKSGSLPEVWEKFIADPRAARTQAAAWFIHSAVANTGRGKQYLKSWLGGSDQAWLSFMLVDRMSEDGPVSFWPSDSGILLFNQFKRERGKVDGGRLLHFNGHDKPWDFSWPLTIELYGERQYRVVNKPLRYRGRRYEVGETFPSRYGDAKALVIVHRLEVAG